MLGLLPWEKWLPPYVLGPLLCIGSTCIAVFDRGLHWWQGCLLGFVAVFGAVGTAMWFATGINLFHPAASNKTSNDAPR